MSSAPAADGFLSAFASYACSDVVGGVGPSCQDAADPPPMAVTGTPPAATAQPSRLLSQCAESKVYLCDFYGSPAVCKHRFVKQYRHPELDQKLREQRTAREARALVRCHKAGIRTPVVYAVDRQECRIVMEFIPGVTVKEALDAEAPRRLAAKEGGDEDADAGGPSPAAARLLTGIGEVVGQLHGINVIHGDLTTSNFMRMQSAPETAAPASTRLSDRDDLVVIDFGLVPEKSNEEERAVDLYLLERAVASAHPFLAPYASQLILAGYERTLGPQKTKTTLNRLKLVRARGRKRSMVG